MGNSIHYVKIKRDKVGICNICGKESKLSWDHVPPRGAIIYDNVDILSIANNFVHIDNPPRELSQNGMKFRTICQDCNNMIGSKYDIAFNEFISKTINLVGDNIGKNSSIEVNVQLDLLIKSILGHLLAAKGELENTVPDLIMKDILHNNGEISKLNIHFWFYPYTVNQAIRDILVAKIGGDNALISILKLYPIAFLITESDMFIGKVPRLNDYYKFGFEENVSIRLDLSIFYDYQWPLIVDDETFIMGGQSIKSSVIAIPRLNK